MAENFQLLRVVVSSQGFLGTLHIEDVQEQLLVVSVGVLAVSLEGRAIERKVRHLLGYHVLAKDFAPDRLVLV